MPNHTIQIIIGVVAVLILVYANSSFEEDEFKAQTPVNTHYVTKKTHLKIKRPLEKVIYSPPVKRKTSKRVEESSEYFKRTAAFINEHYPKSTIPPQKVKFDSDAALYQVHAVDFPPLAESPIPVACARSEFTVDELDDFKPNFAFRPVIGGHRSGNVEFATIVLKNADNAHVCTSLLKRYLACLIKDQDLNTVALDKTQTWLNNVSQNGSFFVVALNNVVINRNIGKIVQAGVPVLAVVEDYVEGLHLGNAYTYCCHNGKVNGISRGSAAPWVDENLPPCFSSMRDNLSDDYCFETIYVFGPQRLIYMHLGQVTPGEQFIPPTPCVSHPIPPVIKPGTVSMVKSFFSRIESLDTAVVPAVNHRHINFYRPKKTWFIHQLLATFLSILSSPLDYVLKCAEYFIMYRHGYSRVEINYLQIFFMLLQVVLPWYISWIFGLIEVIMALSTHDRLYLDFSHGEIQVRSELAEKFINFVGNNKVDAKGYPYGFYYVDTWNIVRLPSSHPQVNATNLVDVVTKFNTSLGHSPNQIPAKYYRLFGCNNVNLENMTAGTLAPPIESVLAHKMTVCPYEIDLAPKGHLDYIVHLTDYEEYSDYGMLEMSVNSLAASASNRLLQDVPEKRNYNYYLQLYKTFWNNYVKIDQADSPEIGDVDIALQEYYRHIDEIEEIPDLEKYKGKKKARMIYGYQTVSKQPFYQTFMKNESLPVESVQRKGTRVITPNTPAFNADNLNWYHKFERILLSTLEPLSGTRIFAKGLNFDQRLRIITQKRALYKYVFCCDFKNFDAHHREDAYKAELLFYAYLGLEPHKADALWNAHKEGTISHDLPCRCSGDLFTGSGNCLVIASMFKAYSPSLEIFCDGDDTLVFSNDSKDAQRICDFMHSIGYELRIDDIVGPYSDGIEFCQMTYFVEDQVYEVNINRRLGKTLNFTASSAEEIARRIYGKLMSLAALRSIGVTFAGEVPDLDGLPPLGDEEWWAYRYVQGSAHLRNEEDCVIDLSGPLAGWFSKICHEINKQHETDRYLPIPPEGRRKRVLSLLTQLSREQLQIAEETVTINGKITQLTELINEKLGLRSLARLMENEHSVNLDILCGSTEFVNCTKTMKCMILGSLGNRPILQSLKDTLSGHSIHRQVTSSASKMLISLDRKEQSNKRSGPRGDRSPSPRPPSNKRPTDDRVEVTDHGSSNSSTKSQPQARGRSHSLSITMSHSGSRSSSRSRESNQGSPRPLGTPQPLKAVSTQEKSLKMAKPKKKESSSMKALEKKEDSGSRQINSSKSSSMQSSRTQQKGKKRSSLLDQYLEEQREKQEQKASKMKTSRSPSHSPPPQMSPEQNVHAPETTNARSSGPQDTSKTLPSTQEKASTPPSQISLTTPSQSQANLRVGQVNMKLNSQPYKRSGGAQSKSQSMKSPSMTSTSRQVDEK